MKSIWITRTAAVAVLLLPLTAYGQVLDTDGDGFSDGDEQVGVVLQAGLTALDDVGSSITTVPTCVGSGLARQFCVDPASPDLFAILVPATQSALPMDPLSFISAGPEEGGLGVTVHVLSAVDPTGPRQVSPSSAQNAIRITESLDDAGEKLGLANYGSPNGLDGSTIWTKRIENFVLSECGSAPNLCQTDQGDVGQALVTEALIRWVLNHEAGHLFALTARYEKRFGGYHVKAGQAAVMAQFVEYDTNRKTGITTFFIPSQFSDLSRSDKLLQ